MGRKKKKLSKPWCWYCNREFDDEKILIQHQKAKHFKCHICYKKLYTGPGLSIHCMQVHKEAIDQVPNSLPTRCNIEIEIYGMEGIPPDDLKEHERQRSGGRDSPGSDDDEPAAKKPKQEGLLGAAPGQVFPAPGMMQGMIPPMGLPPQFSHMGPPMMGPMGPMPPFMAPPGMQHMLGPPMMGGPSKPLFPSAVPGSAAAASSAPVGADFKPLTSQSQTFTSNPTISAPPTTNSQGNTNSSNNEAGKNGSTALIATTGAASKIIHPQEDVSLEELMARMPKYAKKVPARKPDASPQPPQSPTINRSTPTATEQQVAAAVQQKQAEEFSRTIMMQRFQAQAAAAAAAAAAQQRPPGQFPLGIPMSMPVTMPLMQMPQMRPQMTMAQMNHAFLGPGANLMRPPPMGLPPGMIGMPPGMSLAYGAPMAFPGMLPMMQPRFR